MEAAQRELLEAAARRGARLTWGALAACKPPTKSSGIASAFSGSGGGGIGGIGSGSLAFDPDLPVPEAVIYTPFQSIPTMPRFTHPPARCPNCGSVMSPYCGYDPSSRIVECGMCGTRLSLAPVVPLAADGKPAELNPQYPTVEYVLKTHNIPRLGASGDMSNPMNSTSQGMEMAPFRFFFLIDSCCSESEMKALREELLSSVALLPETCEVGIATFGTFLQLYEIGRDRSVVFRGCNEISDEQMKTMLGLNPSKAFIRPLSDCLLQFIDVVEKLETDPWPVPRGQRPCRALGASLSIIARLLGFGHLMVFLAGPATIGPGTVVSTSNTEYLRGWDDIRNNGPQSRHVAPGSAYYSSLIPQFCSLRGKEDPGPVITPQSFNSSIAITLFSCALEQTGLLELHDLVEAVGGEMFICESFDQNSFRETLRMALAAAAPVDQGEANVRFAYRGVIEVSLGQDLKVGGYLGQGIPVQARKPVSIGDGKIGLAGTDRWVISGVDSSTTMAIILELKRPKNALPPPLSGRGAYRTIQLRFTYLDPLNNATVMRVTNIHVSLVNGENHPIATFDQEAGAALISRIAMNKAKSGSPPHEIVAGIDRSMILMCRRFGEYEIGRPETFKLHPALQLFPLFLFHFRRSAIVNLKGETPDRVSLQRFRLTRASVPQAIKIMQPPLFIYTAQNPAPAPAPLDATSALPDRVLLLDTSDRVIVWTGNTVAKWREDGWADKEGYENIKMLINKPQEDARRLLVSRFPAPHLTVCDQGTSQARFLLSRLNPSKTFNTIEGVGEQIFTNDISLSAFVEYLKVDATGSAAQRGSNSGVATGGRRPME